MKCTIQNLARRPIALHCNSGETLHLPPGYVHEVPEEELKGNTLVEKLKKKKLLSVKPAKAKAKKETASPSPKASSKEKKVK